MHGLPTIGTIGLGWFEVSGRSRVPSPPAITTAFKPFSGDAISRQAEATYRSPAATAIAKPIQKTHRGQLVPSWVTSTKPTAAYSTHVAALPRELTENSYPRGSTTRAPTTSSVSRATITASAGHGSRSAMKSMITAASIISRSASGSANLPNSDSTRHRRASQPST